MSIPFEIIFNRFSVERQEKILNNAQKKYEEYLELKKKDEKSS